MEIPQIPKEKGYIIQACNWAFHKVKEVMPERIKESHDYDQLMAAILGFAIGGYGVASLGELAIETANKLGANFNLESITSHCLAATVASPFILYGIAPDKTSGIYNEDPIYTTGVISVMTGASIKALEVLLF